MKVKEGKTLIKVGKTDEPGLIELSVSKAKKWKTCQMSFKYRYHDKLVPRVKSRPLTLGGLVHECIEFRALGENPITPIKDFKKNVWDKLFEEERIELGDIPTDAYRIMRGYHQYYKETDKIFKTIAVEVPFCIRIPSTSINCVGLIDLIVEDTRTGNIWCVEHKTTKKDIPSETFRMTDVQTAVYSWVMHRLADTLNYDPKKVAGVIFDYLKTKPPTIPEILKDGSLSKRKIKCDRYTYLEWIKKINGNPEDYKEILDYMDTNVFYSRVPMAKSRDLVNNTMKDFVICGNQIIQSSSFTRNLSWTCDVPRCDYRDLCLAEMQGLDTETIIKLNYEVKEEETKDGEKETDD